MLNYDQCESYIGLALNNLLKIAFKKLFKMFQKEDPKLLISLLKSCSKVFQPTFRKVVN